MINHNNTYAYYDVLKPVTLCDLIRLGKENWKDKTAFYTEDGNTISYSEFSDMVSCLGTFIISQGFTDAHIGILSENSVSWCLAFFGICNSGNVVVPLDKNESDEEIQKLLRQSDCEALFYSEKFEKRIDKIDGVKCFSLGEINDYVDKGKQMIERGTDVFEKADIDKDRLAAIVFTSGTMGDKKGVMLSHENLVSDAYETCRYVKAKDTQILLPLHHTFAWASGMLAMFFYGVSAHISSDLKRIVKDLNNNKPQNISAVPMMVEMIYKNILNSAKKQNKEAKLKRMITFSNFLMSMGIDIRRKLFREIHDSFGGELQLIICGGAALDTDIEKGLYDLGFTVLSGYGITECSPVVSVNRNKDFRFGSVGKPLCCNEVKIADKNEKGVGEILVSGSNVMKGYYKDIQATEEAFDGKWFKTGDYGYIDKDGYLFITGRKKNLIVLANGENVAAEEIEMKLMKLGYVKEVMVYEENQKIVAEFYLDDKISKETLDKDIARYNDSVPQYKNISYIKVRDIPFEKTTTLKIKRVQHEH